VANIGFDWGTTTTSVSFLAEKNTFDYLRFGGNHLNTFPTVIAYKKADASMRIGVAAQMVVYAPQFDVYSNLKLKLDAMAMDNGGRKHSPYEATRDFIGKTIGEYVYVYKKPPQRIVFTVPDSWGKDVFRHPSLMFLEQIIGDIGFDVDTQISFCSEPVAAAAYYCKEVCRNNFRGSLLIVDMGGGTIDLTLCKIENGDNILVIKRCGELGDTSVGCSGEAFDLEMTKKISNANNLNLEPNSLDFFKLKNAFEITKISDATTLDNILREYYAEPESGRKELGKKIALEVMDSNYMTYPVTVDDIVEAFDKINRNVLKKCVNEMLDCCREEKFSIENPENFRVILTGGFSNLYCVEATVRETLGAPVCGKDMRFDSGINRESRSTAIAHGAAIIANEKVNVDELFQKNVGFFCFDVFNNSRIKITLLKSRSFVKNLREPTYSDRFLRGENVREDSSLTVFIEENSETNLFQVGVKQLCPIKDKHYTFGFSLGRRQTLFLHSLDEDGVQRKIPIGLS